MALRVLSFMSISLHPSFSLTQFHTNIKRPLLGSLHTAHCRKGGGPREVPRVHEMLMGFDPQRPIEESFTPPSSWYTEPEFLAIEMERVFSCTWQVVGHISQVENPFNYFTGSLGSVQYVVCRNEEDELNAFHNVCRHHVSPLASGSGSKTCFVCPYHGWTYSLNGSLQRTTRIGGIKNFKAVEYGLVPISVATWGQFVLINMERDRSAKVGSDTVGDEWLGDASTPVAASCNDSSLCHVARRNYIINCNWKVYCDNYLDGGYHVPFAHGGLAADLDLQSYLTELYTKISVQTCRTESGVSDDRLGNSAFYAFIYPNFMINRYGPWMDTNLVLPISVNQCQVIFDYFLDTSLKEDKTFIEKSLQESHIVQVEDVNLCEGVQRGLDSPTFDKGRYAPKVEMAMHHFHTLLWKNMINTIEL